MKKIRKLSSLLILVWSLVCCGQVGEGLVLEKQSNAPAVINTDFKPSGHAKLDAVRRLVLIQNTDKENYKLRIFLLKQWVCTLQQMGANTEPFLDVSEIFKRIFSWNLFGSHGKEKVLSPKEGKQIYPAIDEGYRILGKIYAECNQLTDTPVFDADSTPSAELTSRRDSNPSMKPGIASFKFFK
jgi:hypothetical protein